MVAGIWSSVDPGRTSRLRCALHMSTLLLNEKPPSTSAPCPVRARVIASSSIGAASGAGPRAEGGAPETCDTTAFTRASAAATATTTVPPLLDPQMPIRSRIDARLALEKGHRGAEVGDFLDVVQVGALDAARAPAFP